MGGFNGFAREAPRFFHELAVEMSREWYQAHKAEYQEMWVAPMEALLADVAGAVRGVYRGVPLAEPRLFRIHRDVRFAADKTPYKLECSGAIKLGEGATMEIPSAVYVQLGMEEYCGAGHYVFTPEQLARWRKKVAAEKTGRQIAALIAAAQKAGLTHDAHEVMVRPPRGIAPDHPRAELLRHKGCVMSFPPIPRGLIHRRAFAGWLAEQATRAAPVVRWVHEHITR